MPLGVGPAGVLIKWAAPRGEQASGADASEPGGLSGPP